MFGLNASISIMKTGLLYWGQVKDVVLVEGLKNWGLWTTEIHSCLYNQSNVAQKKLNNTEFLHIT